MAFPYATQSDIPEEITMPTGAPSDPRVVRFIDSIGPVFPIIRLAPGITPADIGGLGLGDLLIMRDKSAYEIQGLDGDTAIIGISKEFFGDDLDCKFYSEPKGGILKQVDYKDLSEGDTVYGEDEQAYELANIYINPNTQALSGVKLNWTKTIENFRMTIAPRIVTIRKAKDGIL